MSIGVECGVEVAQGGGAEASTTKKESRMKEINDSGVVSSSERIDGNTSDGKRESKEEQETNGRKVETGLV